MRRGHYEVDTDAIERLPVYRATRVDQNTSAIADINTSITNLSS